MAKNNTKVTIEGFSMEKYGLNCLTGEACAYGLRLLFDVSDDGKQLLKDFFSLLDISFPANWNSSVNGKDATGSIMMPRQLWEPLAIFIMFHIEQCDFVLVSRKGINEVRGYVNEDFDDELLQSYPTDHYDVIRNYASKDPSISRGGRNVHQMTRRSM